MKKVHDPIFNTEFLSGLKLGDSFETGGVFPGVCDEPLKWRLAHINGRKRVFHTTYLGAAFGEFSVTLRNKKTLKLEAI